MRIFNGLWAVAALAVCGVVRAQPATEPATQAAQAGPTTRLANVVVTSELDQQRIYIAPALGATEHTIGLDQIANTPGGEDTTTQQVLLRAPGVVADSFGQEHVRGEHNDLTYRVNGVILPEGLNGFGQELDTRLIDSMTLIDGTLPAQFGFQTAGIIDVTTKSGASLDHNELSLYGGSYDTLEPSFQLGGTSGKWDYFVTGSYKHDDLGIENTTSRGSAVHDVTSQERGFAYVSYHIDDTSRISLLLNGSNADFQIPDTPGLAQQFALAGHPYDNSSTVNETQNEQQYYSVVSYQKSEGNLSMQTSVFGQYGHILFQADPVGDLIFQGVAGSVFNSFITTGFQFDGSYIVNDQHTVRAGLLVEDANERLDTATGVFTTDAMGNQNSDMPETIYDNSGNRAVTSGIYLQDEWRLTKTFTINYGVRYDRFDANFDTEDQVSPRLNFVWKLDKDTTAHWGYARYFDPPPLQDTTTSTINKFNGTTNAPASLQDDAPRAERSDYYDIGLSRQITKPWVMNLDAFYKNSRNLLDLGQFGDAVILSPYNYRYGGVYGAELSSTYSQGGFSWFGNFAWVVTHGREIDSQQFQFAGDELAYIATHDVKLDHESEYTASMGFAYNWKNDRVYIDALYGSGLRAGFANLDKEPQYCPVNLGYEHAFHTGGPHDQVVRMRAEVINVFDEIYQLRNGTGLGVNASQYGQRRGIYVGMTYAF